MKRRHDGSRVLVDAHIEHVELPRDVLRDLLLLVLVSPRFARTHPEARVKGVGLARNLPRGPSR